MKESHYMTRRTNMGFMLMLMLTACEIGPRIEQAPIVVNGARVVCFHNNNTPDDASDDERLGSGRMSFNGSFIDEFSFEGAYNLCATEGFRKGVYCVINFADQLVF